MATFAARSALRSASTSARGAAARLSAGVKPRAAPSPFRVTSQKPLSARILRSPVEMRSVSAVSMLPYHTATASALLTSMLSAAPRSHAWTLEGNFDFLRSTQLRNRPTSFLNSDILFCDFIF
ncbi:hypothetical protein BUALT_Bualt03G0053700 [Buddleja alternifolia]|uniref:Protein NUCLEAR FUSION DEFECTIVE 6, chloroplastic/mitochondrial-like n=1 Tax=Buddleja alternifolia TaxID=168488 RepID=A0AAV6XYN8_9LAMI|nr:hypothetical protein BUALT_Bualt03G0053700 [Buddleja alternifolia]